MGKEGKGLAHCIMLLFTCLTNAPELKRRTEDVRTSEMQLRRLIVDEMGRETAGRGIRV
jgi:hypothetical protein